MRIDGRTLALLGPIAGLWWLLTDGSPASWVIGLPAVAAAVWAGSANGAISRAAAVRAMAAGSVEEVRVFERSEGSYVYIFYILQKI